MADSPLASAAGAFSIGSFVTVVLEIPFTFGFGAGFVFDDGLFASAFSAVRLADAAVGRVIRSRKLPSTGARLRRAECEESLEVGRGAAASDVRGFVETAGFGL